MAKLNGVMLKDITLPAGWMWEVTPNAENRGGILSALEVNIVSFPEAMKKLKTWLVKYELGVTVYDCRYERIPLQGRMRAAYFPYYLKVGLSNHEKSMAEVFGEVHDHAGNEHPPHTIVANDRVLACTHCSRSGISLWQDDGSLFCYTHSRKCETCDRRCNEQYNRCSECAGPRGECRWCGTHVSGDDYHRVEIFERDGDNNPIGEPTQVFGYCSNCLVVICQNCFSEGGQHNTDIGTVCRTCFNKWFDEFGKIRESFEEEELPATGMVVPTTTGRERVRDIGVEIEGGGDGNALAKALTEAGLCGHPTIAGYHHGVKGFPVAVESDASVDWEMVLERFNPAKIDDMRKVNNVLKIARKMVKDGKCYLDLRCGTHMHVDAHGANVSTAFNLNTLFGYMEDVIFRLAAAKWDVHRAVRYGAENGAAQPVPKGPFRNGVEFALTCNRGDHDARYWALNMQPFFHAVHRNCGCGAIRYGRWEDCTCNLGKCTFEFRVFNSTLNPRKLHAYMALSQAMVAKALTMPEVNAEDFTPQGWSGKVMKKMTEADITEHMEGWKPRLTYMFNELPLTADEKASLRYCVENSDMKILGTDFIAGLA